MGEISSTSVDIEKEPAHLTFIGGGHLAQALVQGIYAKSSWAGSCKISITARRSDRAQELRNTFPRAFVTVNNLHPQIWTTTKDEGASHTVIICTRPADVPGVVRQICSMLATMNRESRPTIMTMCPGIRTKQLEELLPQHTAIVRSMPNTPVACCEGATALFPNAAAADRVHPVRKVLQDVSPSVCILESESHIDVVAAIAGSSAPAYFYYLIEALALTGEAYGIPSELAESLVTQSCVGAGMLARSANRPPAVLRQEVCVPGGSTEKAIAELNVSHFQSIIRAAAEKSLAANRAMANTDT